MKEVNLDYNVIKEIGLLLKIQKIEFVFNSIAVHGINSICVSIFSIEIVHCQAAKENKSESVTFQKFLYFVLLIITSAKFKGAQ